ncbi:MAG: HEAT repeat domain-containing protein [Candidatus Krumholzibacteriota bacterium]|nr:HEAT repeat domain-containing protein [Candidatus Krumholzibacteriota bacterium]
MKNRFLQPIFLGFLAIVFTIGLSFATVELPYRIDHVLQDNLTTPDFDSQVDETSRLQTELFIGHYHLREIGYACFAVMILLLIIGFSTRRTGLAAVGAFTFMLPVFAQFAGVMFFLAGLGVLNVLWLPLLDISFDLQRLGMVIHAPFDLLNWLLRRMGLNAYWYIVYFFIGGGLLVFFLGTYAWLSSRAGRKKVADLWIYRLSRHPQYAGWILWSYGVYLLLLLARYPKRSWGISGSLPWLLSTIFIVGVAMVEEIKMEHRHGEAYAGYRLSAPFLFPLPRFLRRFFSLPLKLMFKKDLPGRKREVAAVLSIYTALLLCISSLFYLDGARRITTLFKPAASKSQELAELADRLDREQGRLARYHLADRLRSYGPPAEEHFIRLMESELLEVRKLAIQHLGRMAARQAVPHLVEALEDPSPDIRSGAARALGAMSSRDAVEPLLALFDDPEKFVQMSALRSLAFLKAEEVLEGVRIYLRSESKWIRIGAIDALGILGSEKAVDLILAGLGDKDAWVRRRAVIALVKTGTDRACTELDSMARSDSDWEARVYAAEAGKRLCRRSD